jgi:hypothetical protein
LLLGLFVRIFQEVANFSKNLPCMVHLLRLKVAFQFSAVENVRARSLVLKPILNIKRRRWCGSQ